MRRRLAILATVASVLGGLGVPATSLAADGAPLPSSIAAVGDSISQAASSGGSLGADYPANSWSTGTNSTVQSHYLRLQAEGANLGNRVFNESVSGAKMVDLAGQMDAAAAHQPDYLTVLIGGNDLCTDTVGQMTDPGVFEAQFRTAMNTITQQSAETRVYVVSIPDVYQLWNLFKGNWWARTVWSLGDICQSLLANPTSNQQVDVLRRAEVRARNQAFNAILANVCGDYAKCHHDGGRVFAYEFARSDVSADYFHPSIGGQANLARETWLVGYSWTTDPEPPQNASPTAAFTYDCADLACSFTDTSTDSDGSIASWSWEFGAEATSSLADPSHTFSAAGDYTVTLTVTDNQGMTGTTNRVVSVTGGSDPPTNADPVADFSFTCTGLSCTFTDASTDSDGSIAEWTWAFGDGSGSTAEHPSHAYVAGGTYSVTLSVTDDDGGTNMTSQSVSVTAPSTSINLSVSGSKVKGTKTASLAWSGATSTSVDVWRDGSVVETTANDGAYTDSIGKGGGSHTYQVCEAGTNTCSLQVSVSY